MTMYSTLQFAKQWLETAEPTTSTLTADDMLLLGAIRQVSLRLDSEFPQTPRWTFFAPWYGTRTFNIGYPSTEVNSRLNTFNFRANLLALTGNVTLGTKTLVDGTNVQTYPTQDQPPYHALRLIGCCNSWYDNCANCNTPLQVSIPGVWGYHRDYANAFPEITTLAGALTDNQTTITVTNIDAPDPYGITPGIGIGSLLKIDDGTDELMEVTSNYDVAMNTATVLRGVNGTTAVAHTDASAGVLVFQVELPVQQAVARQAGLMYARQGKYTTMEVVGMTEVRYPADWLAEIRAVMGNYANGY